MELTTRTDAGETDLLSVAEGALVIVDTVGMSGMTDSAWGHGEERMTSKSWVDPGWLKMFNMKKQKEQEKPRRNSKKGKRTKKEKKSIV